MISDNQRRTVCRILFLLACVAPTSTVGYWICHPQTAAQWQQQIHAQLGVTTSIESIETPGPYVTILRGVKFTDSELGEILNAMEVKVELGETNLVSLSQKVYLTNAGLVHLVQTINEHLIRAHAADRPWQINFLDEAIIAESIHAQKTGSQFGEQFVACNMQVRVEPLSDGTMARVYFQLPDSAPEHWVACELLRSHPDTNKYSQQWLRMTTNNMNLPCWLLGDLVPDITALGPRCQFAGSVELNPHENGLTGGFKGMFSQIDSRAITRLPTADRSKFYAAEVVGCTFDGGVPRFNAELIRPDGSRSPIENTLTVVEQFDFTRALRSAAESNNYQHADTRWQ